MGKIAIQADQYFNNKSHSYFGIDTMPTDFNAGLVSPKTDKYGMNEATEEATEQNIRERFGLESPFDNESY